jgi:hypothetical protein
MHLLLTPLTAEERNARKKHLEQMKEKAAADAIAKAKAAREQAAAEKAKAQQPPNPPEAAA